MDRLERALHEANWLSTIVAFFMGTPISYLIFQHVFEPGIIGMDDAVRLGEVFAATAPMTIAVVLIGAILMGDGWSGPVTMILIGGILWLSVVLGNRLGSEIGNVPETVRWWSFWHPDEWLELFKLYLERYGLGLFLSSIAIGLYIARQLTWTSPVEARPAEPM